MNHIFFFQRSSSQKVIAVISLTFPFHVAIISTYLVEDDTALRHRTGYDTSTRRVDLARESVE